MCNTHDRAEEFAWAAGVVDSGGQVSIWKDVAVLRVRRQDPAILYRLAAITGEGAVQAPISTKSPRWMYHAEGDAVLRIVEQLAPWLSRERLEQFQKLTPYRAEA
jgi:hypothetical protein